MISFRESVVEHKHADSLRFSRDFSVLKAGLTYVIRLAGHLSCTAARAGPVSLGGGRGKLFLIACQTLRSAKITWKIGRIGVGLIGLVSTVDSI